ncbi:MAG: MBL fold metallo-hydrolase [Nanoarchaeota archaeon]|nr:MBL fold metallo-hydrolase [Nanoarchaeota archaeon]
MFQYKGISIEWLGHCCFKIIWDNQIIFIDPYLIYKEHEKADVILITHEHVGHFSIPDIKELSKPDTKIVCTERVATKIDAPFITIMHNNETIKGENSSIQAIPAYNLKSIIHQKGKDNGYIITIDKIRIYHTGDTDFTPELANIKNIDILMIPIKGRACMNLDQTLDFIHHTKPKIVIPMHYNPSIDRKLLQKFIHKIINSKIKLG